MNYLSVSSLQLHSKNPRRWCLQYLEGIREPSTAAQSWGTLVHELIEEDLNECESVEDAENCPEREMVKKWSGEFKGKYGSGWKTESFFQMYLPNLPPVRGFIDAWKMDWDTDTLYIFDHKTGNVNYMETKESLPNNWQLVLYAEALSPGFKGKIVVGHNQFPRLKSLKPRGSTVRHKIVENILTRERKSDIMSEIVEEMRACQKTASDYKSGGMSKIRETPDNMWWYGRTDPFYDVLSGKISMTTFKDTFYGI